MVVLRSFTIGGHSRMVGPAERPAVAAIRGSACAGAGSGFGANTSPPRVGVCHNPLVAQSCRRALLFCIYSGRRNDND